MPRLYLSPDEFLNMPFALGFANQLSQAGNDVVTASLIRASSRVDGFCDRRIGVPGATIVTYDAFVGDTTLAIDSTLGFDNKDEQAVIIGTGATQEIIPILSGGVQISPVGGVLLYIYPYAGVLQLASPLTYYHAPGESAVGCYRETREAGSSSGGDPYSDFITQEGQMASAHAPSGLALGAMTRKVFLRSYPIIQVIGIQASYSFTIDYFPIPLEAIKIVQAEGYYQFAIGIPVYERSTVQTTYISGYKSIPEDIKDATAFYAMDDLVMMNPNLAIGITHVQMSKRSVQFASLTNRGKTPFETRAESILLSGNYKRLI